MDIIKLITEEFEQQQQQQLTAEDFISRVPHLKEFELEQGQGFVEFFHSGNYEQVIMKSDTGYTVIPNISIQTQFSYNLNGSTSVFIYNTNLEVTRPDVEDADDYANMNKVDMIEDACDRLTFTKSIPNLTPEALNQVLTQMNKNLFTVSSIVEGLGIEYLQ